MAEKVVMGLSLHTQLDMNWNLSPRYQALSFLLSMAGLSRLNFAGINFGFETQIFKFSASVWLLSSLPAWWPITEISGCKQRNWAQTQTLKQTFFWVLNQPGTFHIRKRAIFWFTSICPVSNMYVHCIGQSGAQHFVPNMKNAKVSFHLKWFRKLSTSILNQIGKCLQGSRKVANLTEHCSASVQFSQNSKNVNKHQSVSLNSECR